MARPRKNHEASAIVAAAIPAETPTGATNDAPGGVAAPSGDAQAPTQADEVKAPEPAPEPVAAPKKAKAVRMKRDESFPGPHTADVHPDEVANWKLHDWVEA
jgi:hypothetical protein